MRRWTKVPKRQVGESPTSHLHTEFHIYIAIKKREREREDSGKKAVTDHG